jgi:hypothetical protein
LATITSVAENTFVFSLVNSPTFFTALNGSGPALGGFPPDGSPEPSGGWRWITGELWDYTNWSSDSPDDAHGQGEDGLSFYSGIPKTPAATWNDLPRDALNLNLGGYVVERDLVFGPIVPRRINEGQRLAFTLSAMNTDLPVPSLSYSLRIPDLTEIGLSPTLHGSIKTVGIW